MGHIPEPVKRLRCCRCGISINPLMARYLWVGYGERGASKFGNQGNTVFHRHREQLQLIFCGPCGDQAREGLRVMALGGSRLPCLDTFERGVVRD